MLVGNENIKQIGDDVSAIELRSINESLMTKRHQVEREKHEALKVEIVSHLITETVVKKQIVQNMLDDVALTVTQVQSLSDVYTQLNASDRLKLTKVIKVNLRTKKEKKVWEALSDTDKLFVSLFMSDDQRKRYEASLDRLKS